MPAKTAEKPPATDVKEADELAAVKAELEAAKAELAANAKDADPVEAAPAAEPEADEWHSHSLVLANGDVVQTSSPVATHHYGKDGSGPHVVVRAFENAPKEV